MPQFLIQRPCSVPQFLIQKPRSVPQFLIQRPCSVPQFLIRKQSEEMQDLKWKMAEAERRSREDQKRVALYRRKMKELQTSLQEMQVREVSALIRCKKVGNCWHMSNKRQSLLLSL